jgi:hypothetical protein
MAKRAKWYVDFIHKSPNEQTMQQVARMLFDECTELMKVRSAKTDITAIEILDAQDRKWRLIVKRLPELKLRPNGFRYLVLATYPDLAPLLKHWEEVRPSRDGLDNNRR